MIITLPNGYRCDIGNDLGSFYVIHEVFHLDNYGSLSIKTTDSILDCGAHIELFSLKVAPLCSRVIAVEPASSNFNLLQKNIALNGLKGKIIPIRRVIHTESGIFVRLFLEREGGWHSIYNSADTAAEILETISVDDLSIELGVNFDVIKIDVEGAEVDLLKGAKQTLTHSVREVIMEYHSRRLLEKSVKILRAYGFNCKIINPKRVLNRQWLLGYVLLNGRLLLRGRIPDIAKVCGRVMNIKNHRPGKSYFHFVNRGILYARKLE